MLIRQIALSAAIAALYAELTIAVAPISYGPVQFRIAEAMTLLPFMLPEAIPGLFIGCLIANLFSGFGLIDVVFGSAATLIAGWITYKMPNLWLAAVPPVLLNALIVGGYLAFITETPMVITMLYIGGSEAIICFALGIPLCKLLKSSKVFDAVFMGKKEKSPGVWVKK